MAPGYKEEVIWELAALTAIERRNARASMAVTLAPLVSRDWILRNIFYFNEDEIRMLGAA